MSVAVIVATYGEERWSLQARRAIDSVFAQLWLPDEVIHVHGPTLAQARNAGARAADTDWLIFCDADDTLDPGYIQAMLGAQPPCGAPQPWLRQPSTAGVHSDGRVEEPVLIPAKPLIDGNYMVIGTMLPRTLFEQVGGFRELALYEDWDLWLRCRIAGAEITPVPAAIYRVGVNDTGRNSPDRAAQVSAYQQIRACYEHEAILRSVA